MEAAKTPFYENAEPPLTAEDVQNLVLISQIITEVPGLRYMILSVIFVESMTNCNIPYNTMMTAKVLPFIPKKMIFGSVCRSRSLAGWKAYLAGKRYITSSITKSQVQKALKN